MNVATPFDREKVEKNLQKRTENRLQYSILNSGVILNRIGSFSVLQQYPHVVRFKFRVFSISRYFSYYLASKTSLDSLVRGKL